MTGYQAELLIQARCTLGEGPVWHEGALWWVDIENRRIHRWQQGVDGFSTFELPERVGFAVPAGDGSWQIGLQSGIHRWDPAGNSVELLHAPEPDRPDNRFNDGKLDPAGRLWAGTMSTKGEQGAGALYRITDTRCDKVLDGVTISNGLAWRDGRMYYIDTPTREVSAFDYDPDSGEIANRTTAVRIPTEMGAPDGMTIDREGMLWIALWGGHAVLRANPESGEILAKIHVPAPNVTSCTFGGPDGRALYITTARAGLSEDKLAAHPLAGSLFTFRHFP